MNDAGIDTIVAEKTAELYAMSAELVRQVAQREDLTEQLRYALRELIDVRMALDEHAIVAITKPQGEITFVNDKFCAVSQYSREELLGQDHRIINSGYHSKEFIKEMWVTIGAGRVWRGDYKNRAKDGSFYWVDTTIVPFVDEEGRPREYVAIHADITARKEAEEALLFFRKLVDQSSDTFEVIDPESGRFLDVNENGLFETGFTREEYLALGVSGIDPAIGESGWRPMMERIREEGIVTGEGCHRRKDGTTFPIEFNAKWVEADREHSYIVTVVRDITERRIAARQIREQAALLDHARDAIFVHALNGIVTYWNRGAERLDGWTAEEMVGCEMQSLLVANLEPYHASLEAVLRAGEWKGETTKLTKAGGEIVMQCRWTLLRDEAGQPKSILSINTDITEKRAMEAHLLRAQRMESIGALAGGIAHDLNNVLAPILMGVELLKETVTEPRDVGVLELMETSGRRGADMVKQVLLFARGVEGRRTVISVTKLVKEVERLTRDTFAKSIVVEADAPEETRPISGDYTQLHQVLMNLCVNARDAMPRGGKLRITARNREVDAQFAAQNPKAHEGTYVMLEIADTGQGMSGETVKKIFDPFFTTKEIGKGTGLGLSTTQAIVKSHGGFITVESEVGRGTTFQVNLPAEAESAQVECEAAKQEIPRGHGELILIFDDEAATRSITGQTLEAYGYHVMGAGDGAEGVTLYAQRMGEIAAVMTDLEMPVLDGASAIRVLKRMNPDVKILVVSGSAAGGRQEEVTREGVKHFLAKPYTAESMLRMLHELLHPAP
ncbi:MAG: PAS domain S-box protein [Chthoniobacteraceae bacterium]